MEPEIAVEELFDAIKGERDEGRRVREEEHLALDEGDVLVELLETEEHSISSGAALPLCLTVDGPEAFKEVELQGGKKRPMRKDRVERVDEKRRTKRGMRSVDAIDEDLVVDGGSRTLGVCGAHGVSLGVKLLSCEDDVRVKGSTEDLPLQSDASSFHGLFETSLLLLVLGHDLRQLPQMSVQLFHRDGWFGQRRQAQDPIRHRACDLTPT